MNRDDRDPKNTIPPRAPEEPVERRRPLFGISPSYLGEKSRMFPRTAGGLRLHLGVGSGEEGMESGVQEAPLVVVADDDPITREFVAGLLRGAGLRVETFPSGGPLVERVRAGGVAMALLDVVMPGMDGIETCRVLKSLTTREFFPVVLVTSRSDADSRVNGLRIGADDYITKPFDERELIARVRGMLRIKRAHDDMQDARARLERRAVRDDLTGLYNERYLQTRLSEEFHRAERHREPLACAAIELNNAPALSEEGLSQLLVDTAGRVRGSVRTIDILARQGQHGFVLILPSTHFSGALSMASRLWQRLTGNPYALTEGPFQLDASVGIALYPSQDITSETTLLEAAARAASQARDTSRGGICVLQQQGYLFRPPGQ